jgi:hypothetical protein
MKSSWPIAKISNQLLRPLVAGKSECSEMQDMEKFICTAAVGPQRSVVTATLRTDGPISEG